MLHGVKYVEEFVDEHILAKADHKKTKMWFLHNKRDWLMPHGNVTLLGTFSSCSACLCLRMFRSTRVLESCLLDVSLSPTDLHETTVGALLIVGSYVETLL